MTIEKWGLVWFPRTVASVTPYTSTAHAVSLTIAFHVTLNAVSLTSAFQVRSFNC